MNTVHLISGFAVAQLVAFVVLYYKDYEAQCLAAEEKEVANSVKAVVLDYEAERYVDKLSLAPCCFIKYGKVSSQNPKPKKVLY